MELKLKKCPFCGRESADLYKNRSYKVGKYFVWVECDLCGARSKSVTSDDDPADSEWGNVACQKVAAAWNTRCADAE